MRSSTGAAIGSDTFRRVLGHFVTGVTESPEAIFQTFGSQPGVPGALDVGNFHGFVTTPSTIAFVDSMLAAALAAIVAVQLIDAMQTAAWVGVVTFFVVGIALAYFGYRNQVLARIANPAQQDVLPKDQ